MTAPTLSVAELANLLKLQRLSELELSKPGALTNAGFSARNKYTSALIQHEAALLAAAQRLAKLREEVVELLFQLDGLPSRPVIIRDQRHCALFQQSVEKLMVLVPEWKDHPGRRPEGGSDASEARGALVELHAPCPFCGEEGVFDGDLPGIMCVGCSATGPVVSSESCDEYADDTEVECAAWAFWNKRKEDT